MKTLWKILTAPFLALAWLFWKFWQKPFGLPTKVSIPVKETVIHSRPWTIADEFAKRSATALTKASKVYWAQRFSEAIGGAPRLSRAARHLPIAPSGRKKRRAAAKQLKKDYKVAMGVSPPARTKKEKNEAKRARQKRRAEGRQA